MRTRVSAKRHPSTLITMLEWRLCERGVEYRPVDAILHASPSSVPQMLVLKLHVFPLASLHDLLVVCQWVHQ
jgi:hypothetical protein